MGNECLHVIAPELLEDALVNCGTQNLPVVKRRRERPLLSQAKSSINGNPTHHTRVEKLLTAAAYFPDALIRTGPVICNPVDQPVDLFPCVVGKRVAILRCEIDSIHELAIDV